jgi:2-polyprenyl-3-methyl-5-hydroxy-6-metoxy-1,4-benzoquinol methylase
MGHSGSGRQVGAVMVDMIEKRLQEVRALAARQDLDQAQAIIDELMAAHPENAEVFWLAAIVWLGRQNLEKGVHCFREALRLSRAPERLPEALALLASGDAIREAVDLCEEFRDVAWNSVEAMIWWGGVLLTRFNRAADAVPVLRRATELAPGAYVPHHNLSAALLALGNKEEAVEAYSKGLTAWNGGSEPLQAIERLDGIARNYDDNELHQFFSQRLLRLHAERFPARRLGRVLELGSGTGLMAAHLPASCKEIIGIDRSPLMLSQAEARGLYNRLIQGDLPDVLGELGDGSFDTILSSCAIYYFADLAPFFRHAARLLPAGGAFLFSVDPADDSMDIAVTGPGEYAHSRAYLRRMADEHGFTTVGIEIDRHRGPPGFWCAFRKS